MMQFAARVSKTCHIAFSLHAVILYALLFVHVGQVAEQILSQQIARNNFSVAVLVIGSRGNSSESLLSLVKHVGEPISRSDGIFDLFLCYDEKAGIMNQPTEQDTVVIQKEWHFAAKSQFERSEECFKRFSEFADTVNRQYSNVIRTRPDLVWFDDVPLPLLDDSIMVRARIISGANVTYQHLSWKNCGPRSECNSSRCVNIDDQLAVVPRMWTNEYFGNLSPTGEKGYRPSGLLQTFQEGRTNDRVHFVLNEDMINRCPCSRKWEGAFTSRLARHNVSVVITPFKVSLAPSPGRPRLRTPPQNTSIDCPLSTQQFLNGRHRDVEV